MQKLTFMPRRSAALILTVVPMLLWGIALPANAKPEVWVESGESVILEESTTGLILVAGGGTLTIKGGVHSGSLSIDGGGDVTIVGAYVSHTDVEPANAQLSGDGMTLKILDTTNGWAGTLTYRYENATADSTISVESFADITFTVPANGGGNGSTNEPPVAEEDLAETTINTAVTIGVLANDSDSDDDPLTIDSVTEPANGTATKDGGSIIYTPIPNFVGTDAFEYTISDGQGGTASATVTVTVKAGTIEIDIKPGDDTNRVNLGSNGVIPVAIFSTEDFDATELDPGSIFLAGSGVRVRGKGNKYLASQEDIDGDGRLDLVVKIETQNLDPDTFQDGGAILKVYSDDDEAKLLYQGWDSLTIVPPQ